jgi:hypothetical protein
MNMKRFAIPTKANHQKTCANFANKLEFGVRLCRGALDFKGPDIYEIERDERIENSTWLTVDDMKAEEQTKGMKN